MQAVGFSSLSTRHQQLELQRLQALADRYDLAGAAEEGVVGHLYPVGQAQPVGQAPGAHDPILAEGGDLLRAAHAHVLAHAERLQPVQVARDGSRRKQSQPTSNR